MLLVGLGGLGAEVAKNLILAGVKGLTLLDHEQVNMVSLLYVQPLGFNLEMILNCHLDIRVVCSQLNNETIEKLRSQVDAAVQH